MHSYIVCQGILATMSFSSRKDTYGSSTPLRSSSRTTIDEILPHHKSSKKTIQSPQGTSVLLTTRLLSIRLCATFQDKVLIGMIPLYPTTRLSRKRLSVSETNLYQLYAPSANPPDLILLLLQVPHHRRPVSATPNEIPRNLGGPKRRLEFKMKS